MSLTMCLIDGSRCGDSEEWKQQASLCEGRGGFWVVCAGERAGRVSAASDDAATTRCTSPLYVEVSKGPASGARRAGKSWDEPHVGKRSKKDAGHVRPGYGSKYSQLISSSAMGSFCEGREHASRTQTDVFTSTLALQYAKLTLAAVVGT
jgi:hypothetical protein